MNKEESKSFDENRQKAHEMLDKSAGFVLVNLNVLNDNEIQMAVNLVGDRLKLAKIMQGLDLAKLQLGKSVFEHLMNGMIKPPGEL